MTQATHIESSRRWEDFHRLPIHLAVVAAALVAAVTVIGTRAYEPAAAHAAVSLGGGAAVMAAVAYARYALGFAWLSATTVYLVLFWLFHFGLSFTAVLVPGVLDEFYESEIAWLDMPNVRLAMLLGVVGAVGFIGGVGLFPSRRAAATVESDGNRTLYLAGWFLLVVGSIAGVLLLLYRGGLGIFSMGYLELRVAVLATTPAPLAFDAAQVGCAFAICGAPRGQWFRPLAAWSLLGALFLVLGLRTEAIVPLAVFAILLTYRGVLLPKRVLFAAVALALVIIPAVKAFRLVGIGNQSLVVWSDVTPLGAFTEMGGTLRATKAYVDWIEDGDLYQFGATYWAPLDRQVLARLVPGYTVPEREDDPRLPARQIALEGSVGLSATGEAYYNFGVLGPFLFYVAIGALFGWLERDARRTPHRAALFAIVMIVFFFNIRGEWLPVPARVGLGAGLVWACHLLGRPRRELATVAQQGVGCS